MIKANAVQNEDRTHRLPAMMMAVMAANAKEANAVTMAKAVARAVAKANAVTRKASTGLRVTGVIALASSHYCNWGDRLSNGTGLRSSSRVTWVTNLASAPSVKIETTSE